MSSTGNALEPAIHHGAMFDTNELVINMGPQHPSTHGVLRVVLRLDGEKVVDADVVIGYLHRGIENLSEKRHRKEDNPPTRPAASRSSARTATGRRSSCSPTAWITSQPPPATSATARLWRSCSSWK